MVSRLKQVAMFPLTLVVGVSVLAGAGAAFGGAVALATVIAQYAFSFMTVQKFVLFVVVPVVLVAFLVIAFSLGMAIFEDYWDTYRRKNQ